MRRKRRNHAPGLKAKVALAELAERFDVHPNQVKQWKEQLASQATDLFGANEASRKDSETDLQELHAKIGQLILENDFLAKALGR